MKALIEAAAWLDEEYRLECMVPHRGGDDAVKLAERRATLATTAAMLREWASTGRPPKHRPVDARWPALEPFEVSS